MFTSQGYRVHLVPYVRKEQRGLGTVRNQVDSVPLASEDGAYRVDSFFQQSYFTSQFHVVSKLIQRQNVD